MDTNSTSNLCIAMSGRLMAVGLLLLFTSLWLPPAATGASLTFESATYTADENSPHLNVRLRFEDARCAGGTLDLPEAFATIESRATGSATGSTAPAEGVDFLLQEDQLPAQTAVQVDEAGVVASPRMILNLIHDDFLFEEPETFELHLVNANPGTCTPPDGEAIDVDLDLGSPATVTITDDEPQPGLAISDFSEFEGDEGTKDFTFTVTLDPALGTGETVQVDWSTEDDSAETSDNDYQEAGGTLNFAPGEGSQTLTVIVNGDEKIEEAQTFFVNLSNVQVSPAQQTPVTIDDGQGQGTILNDDSNLPKLSINDPRVVEGNSGTVPAEFTVTLSPASDEVVTVDYRTQDRTAIASGPNADYDTARDTLTFQPGETEKSISIDVYGDTRDEPDEMFVVKLENPSDNAFLADNEGKATIIDDDGGPMLSVDDVSRPEGNASETTVFQFNVTLSAASDKEVGVTFLTRAGTAELGRDYRGRGGQLLFSPGEISKVVDVEVIGDAEPEEDEVFYVVLSHPRNAGIANAEGTGTIINDDGGGAANVSIVSGNNQTGQLNQPLPEPLVVEVTNEEGEPVENALVAWSVATGEATLESTETPTDEQGRASNGVTLGTQPGTVEIVASVPGVPESVTFSVAVIFLDPTGLDEIAEPVAVALNEICLRGDDLTADLREICLRIAQAGRDRQIVALHAIAPEELAAQGTLSLEAHATQLRTIAARLTALHTGVRVSSPQVAVNLNGISVTDELIADLFAKPTPEPVDALALLNKQLPNSQSGETQMTGGGASADSEQARRRRRRFGLFLNARIGQGERPGTIRETGFDFDLNEVTAGFDFRVTDSLNLGLAGGYMTTDAQLAGNGGELTVDVNTFSFYWTYYRAHFFLDGILSYGSTRFDTRRDINFLDRGLQVARSDPSGTQLGASLTTGYDWRIGSLSLGGFGRVDYLDGDIDPFEERGAPGLNLAIAGQQIESLLGSAGLNLTYSAGLSWGVLSPTLRLSYLHEFADDSRLITAGFVDDGGGTTFAIPTDEPDREYFNARVGFSAAFVGGFQLFMFHERDLARDDLEIDLTSLGLRFAF